MKQEKVCNFCPNKNTCGFISRNLQSKCDTVATYYLGVHDAVCKIHDFFENLNINDYVSSITNGVGIINVHTDDIEKDLIKEIESD